MRILLALFLSCSLVAFGQKRRDHKVVKFSPEDVQAIFQNNVAVGYYFACVTVDGEFKRVFGVQLYDKDLQPTHYKEFKTGAYSVLDGIQSDGRGFCIKFYNAGKGKTELILTDDNLEQTGLVSLKNSKGEISSLYRMISIDGVGFGTYHKDKKRFCLNVYTPQGKILWTYTSDYAEKKALEYGVRWIAANGNLIAFTGTNYRSMFKADKNDQFLLLLDPKTGQKLLRMNLANNVGLKNINSVTERTDGYILTGNCYFDKNSGAALWHISKEGKLLKERYVNVLEESGKLDEVARNKTKYAVDGNSVHEINLFEDGRVVILSETSGEQQTYLITCCLDKDWKVESVNSILASNDEKLPEVDMSENRYSAYRYMLPSNADKFSFVFVESRNFSSNHKVSLINAVVDGSKVKKSEWKIVSEPTFYKILPAKAGHVVICEFHEKEKRLSLRMEEF